MERNGYQRQMRPMFLRFCSCPFFNFCCCVYMYLYVSAVAVARSLFSFYRSLSVSLSPTHFFRTFVLSFNVSMPLFQNGLKKFGFMDGAIEMGIHWLAVPPLSVATASIFFLRRFHSSIQIFTFCHIIDENIKRTTKASHTADTNIRAT